MQAIRDRSWSRPYNPKEEDSIEGSGTHRGPYAHLNVRNRQPGYHYAYGHRDDRGGITTMQHMGFSFVRRGDPESLGLDLPAGMGESADNTVGSGKFVLMKIPLSIYAKRLEETAAAQRASRMGPTQRFTDRNAEFVAAQGGRAPRGGAAYALPDHKEDGYHYNNSLDPNAEV